MEENNQISEDTKKEITHLISENPVMLFMKGAPEAPQCGFSARVVQILDFLKVKYHSFDVLSNEKYSPWNKRIQPMAHYSSALCQ